MKSKGSRKNKAEKTAARIIGDTIKSTVKITAVTAVSAALFVYPQNIR